jgi:predicted RNase H-like nuclease
LTDVIAIGLDGFRKGWVAVTIDGDRRSIAFPSDVSWLVSQHFDRAAIDIPIGMPDDGDRLCDRLARAQLKPHGARVFSGARRWLWEQHGDPASANEEAIKREQTRISLQLWHIGAKIMEVDTFVRAHRHLDLREVHPELVFLRLNSGVPLSSKRTEEGLALRSELLTAHGFTDLHVWLTIDRHGTGAKRDDVLDACAVALAASAPSGCLPDGDALRDGCDLPMQIWF